MQFSVHSPCIVLTIDYTVYMYYTHVHMYNYRYRLNCYCMSIVATYKLSTTTTFRTFITLTLYSQLINCVYFLSQASEYNYISVYN